MVFAQTNVILGLGDPEFVPEGGNLMAAALNAGTQLSALMKEMAADRRRQPRDDLTSALVNTELEDGAMTEEELSSFFVLSVLQLLLAQLLLLSFFPRPLAFEPLGCLSASLR